MGLAYRVCVLVTAANWLVDMDKLLGTRLTNLIYDRKISHLHVQVICVRGEFILLYFEIGTITTD